MSLCCFPDFLSSLWKLVYTEHSQSSKTLARNMATEDTADPFVPLLLLFCSCFGQYFVVLSDNEIYEQEQPFSLKQLGTVGDFVNSMLFNIVWNHYDELKNSTGKNYVKLLIRQSCVLRSHPVLFSPSASTSVYG